MYKALIQPIIDYPSIPNCIVSDTNKLQLQRIQNKAIRFIKKYSEENLSIEQTHNRYNIDPLNVRLINKAKRSWERFKNIEEEIATESTNENQDINTKDHYWWRRVADIVARPVPDPVYLGILSLFQGSVDAEFCNPAQGRRWGTLPQQLTRQ